MSHLHLILVKNLKYYPIKPSYPIPKLLTRKKYYSFKAISLDNLNTVSAVSPQVNCLTVTDLDDVNIETALKQVVSFQEDPDLILHVDETSENAVYQEADIGSSVDPEDTFTKEEPPNEFLSNALRRISTFKNWPFVDHHYIIQLASAGFYFTGTGDLVRCFHCHVILRHKIPRKDPFMEHLIKLKRCGFIRQERDILGQSVMYTSLTELLIFHSGKLHFQILSFHQRLETFQGTSEIFHNPRHLARAGFSYDGYADAIKCFYCGERQSPGNEYGRNLDTEGNNIINILEEDLHQIHPSLRCRNCEVIRACLMFLPCGHLYCLECGITVVYCYLCGNPATHIIVCFKFFQLMSCSYMGIDH